MENIIKHILFSIALLTLFALPALAEARVATLQLSGPDWRIHEDADGLGADRGLPTADPADAGWIPATVPGNIQADVEAAHHLTPHWYGAGDDRMFDVAHKDWWYRKDVVIPESYQGRRLTLVFDGVDYDCEVWLNGTKVGSNAGMFRRITIDVTGVAKPGESNQLAVRIARIPEALEEMVRIADRGPGFMSGMIQSTTILEGLKSPTTWAWDWGVAIYALGIWKDVRLEATGPARIEWTRVETALSEDHSKATVAVSLEIDSEKALDVSARFRIDGPDGAVTETMVDVPLTSGYNEINAGLELEHPELWWPAGHGGQPLYTLQVDLQTVGGGEILDSRRTRFGVRDVSWVHTEGASADHISRYQLILNGRPIRTMGSNLIPPDLLFGRMGPKTLDRIYRVKDIGANFLRLWGGGVILHKEAFDLADELGIMLVLEIPLANKWPNTNEVFLANLDVTARNIFKQTRNHPSIVEFGGGNEMPWRSTTIHPALQVLQKAAAEESDRIFRASCPDHGGSHGPWFFDLTTDHSQYEKRSTGRAGEFGTSSPANLENWHRTIPPASQWPIIGTREPIQRRKNIVNGAFKPEYWLAKATIEELFGQISELPILIEAGQFYGAEGLRYATDAFRRKGRRLGGFMTWDFNEPWPNGAGSFLIDYDGRTLMNYDFFKQAVAPVALSLKYDSVFYPVETGIDAELFITSDAPGPVADLQWSWLARDRRGGVLDRGEGTAAIDPIESKSLGAIRVKPFPETALGPLFLELRLEDLSGRLLTERIHVFAADGTRNSFAGLLRNHGDDIGDAEAVQDLKPELELWRPVTRTTLEVAAAPLRMEEGREVLDLTVSNRGAMTALFCQPRPLLDDRGDLFIDNNHSFIPPGESRVIRIRGRPARAVARRRPGRSACPSRRSETAREIGGRKSEVGSQRSEIGLPEPSLGDGQGSQPALRSSQSEAGRSGLTLAQTGWRITCWNADDLIIEPGEEVLLAVGRRDAMCREFAGYGEIDPATGLPDRSSSERRIDPSGVAYAVGPDDVATFEFDLTRAQARRPVRLRIHTADQAAGDPTRMMVSLNGGKMESSLPAGLGIQKTDPSHLAFPASVEFVVDPKNLRSGTNRLEVRVDENGWFSWDAMELISQ